MSGAAKGMIVGFFNVLAVAFCIAAIAPGHSQVELFILITMFGSLPGTGCGAVLGHFAQAAKNMHRGILLVIMISLACLAVALLGDMFDVEELIVASCVPTAAACSILERWTRVKEEPVPVARVA